SSPRTLRIWQAIQDYGMITLGALIVAANVPLFLEPNNVISTGITGIGMLAHYLWGWPIGLVTLLINIPLILAGIRWGGGWRFFMRTIYAVLVLTLGIDGLSRMLPPIQVEPLLYTLFGGLLDGIGIGLVLRGSGTTGGTDIIAQLLSRYRGIAFGNVFIVVNTAILLAAALVVGIVPVLYALIVNYVSGRVVDTVQEGAGYARAAIIISQHSQEISQAIFTQLGRGVTLLEARGGYTQNPQPALYVVVTRSQVTLLKRLISEIDPRAFVVVSEAHEVLGEGFNPVKAA
ncbi:MAG TPA: YitT family protein, partial [Anaerolineae bacterium]|nr:YitT family protein [Anaerolineae bacterium]